jgi:chromosome segregation ATPase
METPSPSSDRPTTDATRDTLRELRERAQSSLEKQRERMRELESQFAGRLQSVADQLAGEFEQHPASDSQASVDVARDQLEEERREWEAELQRTDAELNERMDELAGKMAELAERERDLEARENEVAEQEQSHGEQAGALATERDELADRESRLASERESLDADQAELASQRSDLETRQAEFAAAQDGRVAELETQLAEVVAEVELRNAELRAAADERDHLQTEAASLRADLESERDGFARERDSWEQNRAATSEEQSQRIAELETQLRSDADIHAGQQHSLQAQLAEANCKADELQQRLEAAGDAHGQLQQAEAAWHAERDRLLEEHNQLANTLEKVSQKLAAVEANQEPMEEVQSKFALALEDLRSLRERNAELEQELVRRPEQNADESAELIALREERDDLAAQVEELKNRPLPAADASDQEVADLQRRFEMAVDDVRQLRAEKERLEEQLASRSQGALNAASGDGEEKWEDLKRRLLMSLEDEAGEVTEERREERASIEHTIRITDDVVASKDREIIELRKQVEHAASAASAEQDAPNQHQGAMDADETIQQQRATLAQLEEELNDKLREAEMELSVERAKIAREQSELAEWRIELESLRDSLPKKGEAGANGTGGKGRWFSKLGLGGDES